MPPTEQSPLLNGHPRQRRSLYQSFVVFVKAEGEPSWLASYRWFIFGSWLNLLLFLVPIAAASHYLNWDAPLRFGFSFVAIVPLAKLLGDATEQMSLSLGQTLAGLLNATFGNAGQVRIVQTSHTLTARRCLALSYPNILLVLGCSFLAGGIYNHESEFQLMTLACITLVIPAAYHSAKHVIVPNDGKLLAMTDPLISDLDEDGQKGLLIISRGTALLLLGVYIAYLIFQLKTHAHLFIPISKRQDPEARPGERVEMSVVAASVGLLAVTVLTSFVADYLVASIEETATRYNIPKTFIGLILLPIVANAAEHVTNKMELTIGICVGSSIQIATFVVPLLVVIGWITGHELTLFFADFETVAFFVSVLLVNLLIQDGKSNYMEGLMLITLYLVIALAFWVS
ncbi:Calcium/proton exchanger [Lactarius hengduanensis]|nr:Calcium/proton exchanger [Lactarius hengduanensis]